MTGADQDQAKVRAHVFLWLTFVPMALVCLAAILVTSALSCITGAPMLLLKIERGMQRVLRWYDERIP